MELSVSPTASASLIVHIGQVQIAVTSGFDPLLLKQIVQTLEKS